ncbi:MAG: hypothetical protein R3277_11810 [Brumimicrobium sp.]|nr:hypothetical protein [Brumimicrobium sp.]
MSVQDLIQQRFTGELNSEAEYIELIVQAFAMLVLGLVLWRMMAVFHNRKKSQRNRSTFFESEYSKHWRK